MPREQERFLHFRVGAQFAAQTDAEHLRLVVKTHGERNLQVFVGMQSAGISEMAVAEGSGFAQQGDDLILCRNQVHVSICFRRVNWLPGPSTRGV